MPDTTSTPVALHPVVEAVTRRIVERSAATRSAYLAQVAQMVAALGAQINQLGPRNSMFRIEKQPDGAYIGSKTEH